MFYQNIKAFGKSVITVFSSVFSFHWHVYHIWNDVTVTGRPVNIRLHKNNRIIDKISSFYIALVFFHFGALSDRLIIIIKLQNNRTKKNEDSCFSFIAMPSM